MTADKKKDNLPFTIENNVLKGKVVTCTSSYSSIGRLLWDTLKNNPDFVGQVDALTETEDTYANILDRAVKCALWLQTQGVGKGDIVAISTHNHLDSFIPCIAALFIGAIFNPWDYEMNTQLARHFMTLTQPKVIFANEKSVGVVLEAAKIEVFKPKTVVFGEYPGVVCFSDVLNGHKKSSVENFRCTEINDTSHTAMIIYSSGTTGLPKGTMHSHQTLLNLVELQDTVNLNTQVPMWFSTLYWISGAILSIKGLVNCTRRIIGPDFDPKTVCELVEKFKVSWLLLSTSMANRFVRYKRIHEYSFSSLKILFTGGASLKQESQDLIRKRLPNVIVLQAYGMTELCGLVTCQLPNTTSGSCGVVCTNAEIKIVDPDNGTVLGPNQNGELCAKSFCMTTGYYNNPEATRSLIDEDGWLHSGDLAYYNEKGELFIIDRLKEIIKYRGYQISPNEIENLLQSHSAVLEVTVVSIPHPTDDEHPVAFVSKVPNTEVTAQELMDMVANNLVDAYKLRGGVKFLPCLPHTHSGKISRKELKAMAKKLAAC